MIVLDLPSWQRRLAWLAVVCLFLLNWGYLIIWEPGKNL
jgi:hypothetical protein